MPPVKETVTGGFGKVLREDVRNAGKVCDGAGNLYDTGVSRRSLHWADKGQNSSSCAPLISALA